LRNEKTLEKHQIDNEGSEAVMNLLRHRSLYRYYGFDLQREVEKLESELAQFVGVSHVVAVSSGTGAPQVALNLLF
jgi:8-amino-3,8-dideoxy-alpha-D-manno-octulosonate transaminase